MGRIRRQRGDASSIQGNGPRPAPQIELARAHVSRHLNRHLPYYFTPEEAHALIDATENERNHLFLKLLWETGVRVSEAIGLRLGDVSEQPGHRDINTTRIYLRLSHEDVKREVAKVQF